MRSLSSTGSLLSENTGPGKRSGMIGFSSVVAIRFGLVGIKDGLSKDCTGELFSCEL